MNLTEVEATPLWERLPPRPLSARETAAFLPANVPDCGMAVFATLPDTSGIEYTVEKYLTERRIDEVIVRGRRWHHLALTDEFEASEAPEAVYEVEGESWGRLAATDYTASETSVHDAAKVFFDGSTPVSLVASYDGETRRYLTSEPSEADYETMDECEAEEKRVDLASQTRPKWNVANADPSEGPHPVGSSVYDPLAFPLDTSNPAVRATARWGGVEASRALTTVGDLPELAQFTEGDAKAYAGELAYDTETGLLNEFDAGKGVWTSADASSVLDTTAAVFHENAEGGYPVLVTDTGDVSLGEFVEVPVLGACTVVVTDPAVVVDFGGSRFAVTDADESETYEALTAQVEEYTALDTDGERVTANVVVSAAGAPHEFEDLVQHPNVAFSGAVPREKTQFLGDDEPTVLVSSIEYTGPLDCVGEVLAANFDSVVSGSRAERDAVEQAVHTARNNGRAESVRNLREK